MLLISIIGHLIQSITWQLSKFVMILSNGHGSLLQSSEFLLLELYQSLWYVVRSKILPKLLLCDRRSISGMSILEWLPPVLSFSLELSWSVQHFLLIITLRYVELLLHCMKPTSTLSGSVAWENTGGWSFKNSPHLSCSAPPIGWFYWFCTKACISCVCTAKSCSIVGGGGGGFRGTPPWPLPLPLPDIWHPT